jgi:hypothetical protein
MSRCPHRQRTYRLAGLFFVRAKFTPLRICPIPPFCESRHIAVGSFSQCLNGLGRCSGMPDFVNVGDQSIRAYDEVLKKELPPPSFGLRRCNVADLLPDGGLHPRES